MTKEIITHDKIESKILTIRDVHVMLDRDLAELYGVETRVLNQAVKRNIERFPERFMFQLSEDEFKFLRSQIVTSKVEKGEAVSICLMLSRSREWRCWLR